LFDTQKHHPQPEQEQKHCFYSKRKAKQKNKALPCLQCKAKRWSLRWAVFAMKAVQIGFAVRRTAQQDAFLTKLCFSFAE